MTTSASQQKNAKAVAAAIDRSSSPLSLGIGQGRSDAFNFDLYLDIRDYPGVDIVAPWQEAELPAAVFSLIHSSQTLEHLRKEEQLEALRRCFFWLVPGGILRIQTPDLEKQLSLLLSEEITLEAFQRILYGEQDYDENTHLWVNTRTGLRGMAELAGFLVAVCEEVKGSISLVAIKPPQLEEGAAQ